MFKEMFLIVVMLSLCSARPGRKDCSPSPLCDYEQLIIPGYGTLGLGGAAPSFAGPNGQNIAPEEDGNRLTNLMNIILHKNDGTGVAGVGMSYTGYKG